MNRLSFLVAAIAVAVGGCFDAAEATEGLKCTADSHCGGGLKCIAAICTDPDSVCADSEACDVSVTVTVSTTESATITTTEATMTSVGSAEAGCVEEGGSCAGGEACCSGICADYGNGDMRCNQQCSYGTECTDSCCCVPVNQMTAYACVDTSYCGGDAVCSPGSGCASPGSSCSYDQDCCGGRCLLNVGNWYSCFKTCTVPTDCASGCCNYRSDYGTYICEAC